MLVEIVTHCWSGPGGQYAKLLDWQLGSLYQWKTDRVAVRCYVAHSPEDAATVAVLEQYADGWPRKILGTVVPCPVEPPRLFPRAIFRNERARTTQADAIWFADCDYLFGRGCLDALEQIAGRPEPLFFPRQTLVCRDHATGDAFLDVSRLARWDYFHSSPQDFAPKTEHVAIGGIQIVPGDVARREGYCPGTKWQQPAPAGTDTIIGFGADRIFRVQLGTPGTPIELPNLYRLRHSVTGDGRVPRALRRI